MRIGGPALGAQILGALFRGTGLGQYAGGGAEFCLGLLGLQFQIDFIEGCQGLADINCLADFDQALCHFARDPEPHVGLDSGLDGANEAAFRRFRLVVHGGDQDRARRRHFLRNHLVAPSQGDRQHGQRQTS